MGQITTFTLLKLQKNKKWWGFTQMAILPPKLAKISGCTFSKLMGSGAGIGFSIKPNLGVYALMMVWEKESDKEDFFSNSPIFQKYKVNCEEVLTLTGLAYAAHGSWNHQMPFEIASDSDLPDDKRMVLTRATIKWSKLIAFWKHVPKTSKAIAQAEGRLFSIGIGEWPWIQQATLSIWESEDAMKNYAYKNLAHLEAIKKTKALNWYSEELFARFILLGEIGSWEGVE